MFCKYCGTQIPDYSKFCSNCGNHLEESPQQSQIPNSGGSASFIPSAQLPATANKSKRSGAQKGIFIGAISLVVVAALVFGGILLFREKQELTDFTADEIYLASELETLIKFSVRASKEEESIPLYLDGEEVGQMLDNGKKGDAEAGDGIYSCTLRVEEKARKLTSLEFTCGSGRASSESIEVHVFPTLTEESAEAAREDYQNLKEDIFESVEEYTDDFGNIVEENWDVALDMVLEVLEEAVEDEVVLHYSVADHTVFAKLTSGLGMLWAPRNDYCDAIGDDVDMTVLTLQPCYTDMGGETYGNGFSGYTLPEDTNYILEMLDVSGWKLRDTLPNYRFPNSQNYDDSAVTLDVIRSFGENQIILWHGHGYYGPIVKSCLVTGEDFDWDAWWWDLEYYGDCVSNRIINSMWVGYDRAIISSGYISKYCGDMENSLVYLAACNSGKSAELANAFTKKGAVVVANSDTILRSYNVAMLYATIDQMLKVNPESGEFYTLEEALDAAKAIYGDHDADPRYDYYYDPNTNAYYYSYQSGRTTVSGVGATPLIFGDGTYRLLDEVPTGTISGKVAQAADRVTPIGGAVIDVYIGETLFESVTADDNGQYAVELPFGECTVCISAQGYISFLSYTDVQAGETSYMETFLMVQGDENTVGVAGGRVINSLSGYGEADVALTITQNWNNTDPEPDVFWSLTTDADGSYEVELPCGNYTVIAEKEGYSKSSFNIVVQEDYTSNQDGMITPEINGSDYLITLTWGENPSDVDSHMVGYMANGEQFHVYYRESSAFSNGEQICALDYDDTNSYGPEHITLHASDAGNYYYYLHKYAGSGPLTASEAKVTIEQGNRMLAVFYIPTDLGDGDYWNIFCIKDGEIVVSNTVTYQPDTSYAD